MSPSSIASHMGLNISPPSSTHDTHQIATINLVTDEAPDHTTHRNLNQQARSPGKKRKNQRRCGNAFFTLKDVYVWHKRTKPLRKAPGVQQCIIAALKTTRLNVLLVFIPASWICHYLKLNHTLVFVLSFLAFIPLVIIHDFVMDELTRRLGQMPTGLLSITLGNTVELILAIIALVKCELTVVRSSMVGFILSNLLWVLGISFFAGGTRFSQQGFGIRVAPLNSSLLSLSVIAVLLPAVFHNSVSPAVEGPDPLTNAQEGHDILSISHGVAIILLFIYLCFLVFQFFSHKNLYNHYHSNVQHLVQYTPGLAKPLHIGRSQIPPSPYHQSNDGMDLESSQWGIRSEEEGPIEDDVEKPQMGIRTTFALLVIVTGVIVVTSGSLVDSIGGLAQSLNVNKSFIGLILLPIVGNADQQVSAITTSVKDSLTLSLGVVVGSSIQIALFIIPFLVTLGWIMGKPLTLLFDPFESIVLFLSVVIVNRIVQNGKSNWLLGMILMCLYVMVAVTFWYYPAYDPADIMITCQ